MKNLEYDLKNLLAGYSQKDLLGLDQILELSFMLMAHPDPEPWVDKFIAKRYPEDLISLVLSLSIPTANFMEQIQKSDMPEWQKEKITVELAATARGIYNKLGSLIDINKLKKNMQENEEHLQRFMREDAWTRSLLAAKNTPALLQLESDFAITAMEFSAFLADDTPAVEFFHAHRNLLADCRKASVDKIAIERYPFIRRLDEGLNETMMLVYSGIDGYGYGDIPFPDVYEYAKKILKKPNDLINAKLDFAMGRYLQSLSSPKKWEEGKKLLDKVSIWIETHGNDYDDGVVLILDVQTRLLIGTYWKNLFSVEPKEIYSDEAIKSIKSAIKIAPIDEDVIVIYSGFTRTMFEIYQIIQKKQILIDTIDILDNMIVLCERFGSSHIYSGFYAKAICYSALHTNHGDKEAQKKAKLNYEMILKESDAPENIKLAVKGALGRIEMAQFDKNHDLSSLDIAIKNLKESLGE